jgi:hypothetical protein
LLLIFSASQRGQSAGTASVNRTVTSATQRAVVLLSANTDATHATHAPHKTELPPKIANRPENSWISEKSDKPELPDRLNLQNLDIFLDADAVDQTARPDENFEIALSQRLPLRVESMVLEFWIDKEGIAVQVRCLEGACNDMVEATLTKLAELRFTPATKNDAPVASRKVMQIDPLPTFGL